ncbi:MAG TPA: hypothetical protein VFR89_05495 [candidate division Zixibacteria bacterium]|nr:hypothetical protein [candidate division Zixibacteria bacterium]
MSAELKLKEIVTNTEKVAREIRELIPHIHDYDLQRLLKKVDADLSDALHDLAIAVRLSEKKTA